MTLTPLRSGESPRCSCFIACDTGFSISRYIARCFPLSEEVVPLTTVDESGVCPGLRLAPIPRPSPSLHPPFCSITKPLLDGPISTQTGGVYLGSEGNGGGSRASISAKVGGGVD